MVKREHIVECVTCGGEGSYDVESLRHPDEPGRGESGTRQCATCEGTGDIQCHDCKEYGPSSCGGCLTTCEKGCAACDAEEQRQEADKTREAIKRVRSELEHQFGDRHKWPAMWKPAYLAKIEAADAALLALEAA